MDALANLAYGIVQTAPSPQTTGVSLVLQSGQGAQFPTAPFDVLMWPAGQQPLVGNAELGRCTARTSDTLTLTRAQYGTTNQAVAVGYQVCQPIDANLLSQLAALTPASQQVLSNTRITRRVLTLSGIGATSGTGYAVTGSAPAVLTVNTDFFDAIEWSGLTGAVSVVATGGSPNPGDQLRMAFTDDGTARALGPFTGFEAATELPTITGGNLVRLDVGSNWNAQSSKWRIVGVSPGPNILMCDLAAVATPIGATSGTVFNNQAGQPNPPLLSTGTWAVDFDTMVSTSATVTVDFEPATGAGYTVLTGPTGKLPGIKMQTSGADKRMVHLKFIVLVSSSTPVACNVNAIASIAATATCAAQDNAFGSGASLISTTNLVCQQIG